MYSYSGLIWPAVEGSHLKSVAQTLAGWAQDPARPAFTQCASGEPKQTITYAQLHERAKSIAHALGKHTQAGDRVLLWYPNGLEFIEAFWGCLYAGVVAVPAAYPDALSHIPRALPRLLRIFEDAGAACILTSEGVLASHTGVTNLDALQHLNHSFVTTDTLPDHLGLPEPDLAWPSDKLALLQYTSGSTGSPRGVMVTHGQLLANQRMIFQAMPGDARDKEVIVSWLPLHHDMGLIGSMMHNVYRGAHEYLMSPLAFVRHPLRWLQAISQFKATISGAPDFAYALCTRRMAAEAVVQAQWDLSSWRYAFCGAETIRQSTLQQFQDRFAPAGFQASAWWPVYGLAEATLLVTGVRQDRQARRMQGFSREALQAHRVCKDDTPHAMSLVDSGQPPEGTLIRIVDPDSLQVCEDSAIGEIWVQSPAAAMGYWKQAELSQSTFSAQLPGLPGQFLRTGDLGFMCDGQLYITGRCKELIIVRGRNFYPNDIEAAVESCGEPVQPGRVAAFAWENEGAETVAVLVEVARPQAWDLAALSQQIQAALFKQHQLTVQQIHCVPVGSLPRTSSGKLQRKACQRLLMAGEMPLLTPTTLGE
jgi:acyl-CoA synthetase (AMP-forming)/AMP-acid ligase II